MARAVRQNLLFSELDRLADYLSHTFGDGGSKRQADGHEAPTGTVDPKRYPIVLGEYVFVAPHVYLIV